MSRNCFIGQSGGPTVAINASLAGIVARCKEEGYDHIYGMINGIKGLLGSFLYTFPNKLASLLFSSLMLI
mgnify:CR=1 FL=1